MWTSHAGVTARYTYQFVRPLHCEILVGKAGFEPAPHGLKGQHHYR